VKRFRPTDAFVDESIRGQRYLMACVLVDARNLVEVRRSMTAFAGAGKRLHFHQELDSARRGALELIAALPVQVTVAVCVRRHGVSEFEARDLCLAALVRELQSQGVLRLIVETRQDDRDDHRTILRTRDAEPTLNFEHRSGSDEPILWVADAVAWAYGAGQRWASLARPVVHRVIELTP
jgi:hypothetical protein